MQSSAHDVIGGRYKLLEVIGSGGMGRVWKAEDELLNRTVAVKEINTPADVTTSAMIDLQLATMREARAAARLEHPGVVQVFDVIWRPGRSWIVMEYVPSRSLHDVIEQDGPLSHQQAAQVGLAVLSALSAAHDAGVLHRDVKPHNVLLAEDGRVVLTDFGLATLEKTAADAKPEPLFGSPFYVAPERLKGRRSSRESDLWSLGATLYTAVEGRPPFRRDSTTQSLAALVIDPPDPQVRSGPLGPVLDGLLVKEPEQRLTAEQAEPMLRQVADRAVGVFSIPGLLSDARSEAAPKPGTSRAGRIAVLVAALLLAGAGTAAVVITRDRYNAPPPAAIAASSSAAAPALAQPVDCTVTNGGDPVFGSVEQADYALPDGWVWHADPSGFRVAVPAGWRQVSAGSMACFHDPDGSRSLVVDTSTVSAAAGVAHWEQVEKATLAAGELPGYKRVTLAAQPGSVAWEYTWQPAGQTRRHERRELLIANASRTYAVDWTTSEPDWPVNLPYLRLVQASLR